jgi:hypothetical protein
MRSTNGLQARRSTSANTPVAGALMEPEAAERNGA